jgi:hypothetical protein
MRRSKIPWFFMLFNEWFFGEIIWFSPKNSILFFTKLYEFLLQKMLLLCIWSKFEKSKNNPIFIWDSYEDLNFAPQNLSQYRVLSLKSFSENYRWIKRGNLHGDLWISHGISLYHFYWYVFVRLRVCDLIWHI